VLTTKTSNQLVGPVTITTPGSFTIQVQNGSGTTVSNGASLTVNPATPSISSISPTTVTPGTFSLTINGSNFNTSNAHIVVTRPATNDQPFTDYTRLRGAFAKVSGVVGATPYITNEVMISSQTNLSGVIVKGIDLDTVGQVTDIVKNTEGGGLDYLRDPKQLVGAGGPSSLFDDDEKPKKQEEELKKVEPKKKGGEAEKDDEAKKRDEAKKGEDEKPPADALRFARRVVPGVIVGRELAKTLRVWVGDDVNRCVERLGSLTRQRRGPESRPGGQRVGRDEVLIDHDVSTRRARRSVRRST